MNVPETTFEPLDPNVTGPGDLIRREPYLYWGQAIRWIVCRDDPIPRSIYESLTDEAEREMLRELDAGNVTAEGFDLNDRDQTYFPIPKGLWGSTNRGGWGKGSTISSIDEGTELYDGGHFSSSRQDWYGVRVPSSFVLDRWPPKSAGTGENDAASPPAGRPAAADAAHLAKSAQREATALAIQELWGGNIPGGLTVGKRNAAIQNYAPTAGLAVPSDRTIRREIRQ